jgi:hypothetical protein
MQRSEGEHSSGQIPEKFGSRFNPCHEKVIAGASARDINQVPLAVVDFFQVGIVGDILDTLL